MKSARDLIAGVLEQVASEEAGDDDGDEEADDDKSIVDQLEQLAAGEPLERDEADRVVRAAAEIAHKAQAEQTDNFDPSEVADFIREVATEAATAALKKHSGELP